VPEPIPDPHPPAAAAAPTSPRGGGVVVSPVVLDRLDADALAEWTALHAGQVEAANPFTSPTWVSAWYRHYVPRDHRRLLWITEHGRLVGVAPMYLQELHVLKLPMARRLTLVGSGRTTPMEIPALLSVPGRGRAVVRALVDHTLSRDVAWCEISLSREQGWMNAHLAAGPGRPAVFQRHQQVRACVVLELADTWDETRAGLKRNVKESIRRARNRLVKDGRPWRVVHRTGADVDVAAVERLLDLHGARSDYQGSASRHHNAYAAPAAASFLRDVLPRLGRAHEASLAELELDGEVVASQLVLHPPGGVYFHSSGFRPEVWELSPVTALQAAVMERAITHGDRWVNFSPGPNEAKLRWSERLTTIDDYAYGVAESGALARYTGFFLARDVRQIRHQRDWFRRPAADRPAGGAGDAGGGVPG